MQGAKVVKFPNYCRCGCGELLPDNGSKFLDGHMKESGFTIVVSNNLSRVLFDAYAKRINRMRCDSCGSKKCKRRDGHCFDLVE